MTVFPSLRHRASKALLVFVAAAGLAQCADGPTSPRASRSGFAFSPAWDSRANRSTALLDEAGLPLDRVRIIVVKPVSDTVKDTTIMMRRGDPEIALGLTVPVRPGEPLSATLQFKSGETILFQGTANVIAVPLSQASGAPTVIAMVYVGPGVTATRVEVLPASGVFSTASPITFVATAFDVNNAALANTPIDWTINDATLGTLTAGGVFTPSGKRGNLVVSATTPTSISGTATAALTPPPASITIVSGNNQTTSTLNAALALPLIVEVKAADGVASVGETVTFTALDGGSVTPATAVTDANGRAQTTLKSGSRTGTYNFSVVSGTLSIGAIATAPAVPGAIAIVSGDAQADTVLKTLANPFVVRVTDIAGVVLPGATVTWTRLTGSGILASATSVTNASGLASVGYTLADVPGAETIRASVSGLATTVTFNVQVIEEPGARATRVEVLPASGSYLPGTPITFTAKAYNALSVEQLNTTFTWSLTDATFGAISAAGVFTPSGKSGAVTVRATTRRGIVGAATINVTQPGPAAIAMVSGDAQTDTVLKTLASPFVVRVTDITGVVLAGVTVSWTRVTGAGILGTASSVTDASGLASVGYTLADVPGTETIRASVAGLVPTVTFTVHVVDEPGARATRVEVLPGSGSYATSTTIAFAAKAFNAQNVEQLNTAFTWSLNDATLGAITVAGVFTPSGKRGTLVVTATTRRAIAGTATAALIPPASTIAVVSGNNQAIAALNTAFAQPLVVVVKASDGVGSAGETVTFTAMDGGSVDPATAVTDANGHAQTTIKTGARTGTYQFAATSGLLTTSATASAPAAPGGIAIVSGDAQADTVLKTLASPFVVRVTDIAGVALAGATVTWTRVTGAGALATTSSVTDAAGEASAGYSLADVPGTETVRASVAGLTPTVTFTVNVVDEPGARATRVDVTPASGLYSGSAAIAFSARAFNNENVEQLATPFTWSVNDATFGAITTSGVFTPTGKVGAVTVIATTRRGIVGSATINIASPNPAAIALISGNAQIDTIFRTLANPFVVRVTDVLGNPVSGATVSWTRVSGFGSPSATTSTTNALGLASLTYTLGDIGGEEVVRASVGGVATTVTFTVGVRDGLGVPVVTGFAYLRVTPSPVSPRVGDTVTFTADSVGAAGGTAPVSVTWASDNPGRGPIDATGRMIVKDTGNVIVTATRNGLVGHGRATVLPAPELIGFTFSPKTLNGITNAALTTSMTFSVRDAGASGVASGTVTITSPTGVTRTCTATTPTSGSRRNGTFDCAITLTAGSDAGVWQVTRLVLTGSITRTFGQSVLATFGITTLTVNP